MQILLAKDSETSSGLQDHAGTTQEVSLSVADLRNLNKIGEISDDASVTLKLGREESITAFDRPYQVRVNQFRGKVPGSDQKLPPIHFLSQESFEHMQSRVGEPVHPGSTVLAWYDRSVGERGVVEIPIPLTTQGDLPKQYELSGEELKALVATLHHEFAHSVGKEEFLAHKAQGEIELRLGLRSEPWDWLEILEHVQKNYDEGTYIRACNEFADYAAAQGATEILDAYYQELEKRIEAQDLRMPDLDDLDIDPDDLDSEYG